MYSVLLFILVIYSSWSFVLGILICFGVLASECASWVLVGVTALCDVCSKHVFALNMESGFRFSDDLTALDHFSQISIAVTFMK